MCRLSTFEQDTVSLWCTGDHWPRQRYSIPTVHDKQALAASECVITFTTPEDERHSLPTFIVDEQHRFGKSGRRRICNELLLWYTLQIFLPSLLAIHSHLTSYTWLRENVGECFTVGDGGVVEVAVAWLVTLLRARLADVLAEHHVLVLQLGDTPQHLHLHHNQRAGERRRPAYRQKQAAV